MFKISVVVRSLVFLRLIVCDFCVLPESSKKMVWSSCPWSNCFWNGWYSNGWRRSHEALVNALGFIWSKWTTRPMDWSAVPQGEQVDCSRRNCLTREEPIYNTRSDLHDSLEVIWHSLRFLLFSIFLFYHFVSFLILMMKFQSLCGILLWRVRRNCLM